MLSVVPCDSEYEKQSNVYRSFRDEMLGGSSEKDFQLRLERWRTRIKLIDERNASRIMWERQEQRKRQLVSKPFCCHRFGR